MEKIELQYPFQINGQDIREIEYDFGEFTANDYFTAMKNRRGYSPEVTPVNDYGMNYSIGVQVILASNKGKGWTGEDFDRLRGSDVSKVMLVGLNFFGATPEEQANETSEGRSESTPSDSTLPEKS